MKRHVFALGLVCVLHGSVCSRATAQGFNRRYDPIVPGNAQFCWSVELMDNGDFVLFHNQPWMDSLYYSSRMGTSTSDPDGVSLVEALLSTPYRAAYPGWSNPTIKLTDGRFAGGGGTVDTAEVYRILLYKFDHEGHPLSTTEIHPTDDFWTGYQAKTTPDGGFIITGVTDATGLQDVFLLKTDSLGQVEWWQTYGHPTRLDYSATVDFAPDGGYYIGGNYPQTLGNNVQWILRTDSVGELLWEVFRGLPIEDSYGFNAATTTLSDGNTVYACGRYTGLAYNTVPELVKLDASGSELWDKTYGFAQFGTGFFVVQEVSPYGDLIACGQRFFSNGMGGGYSKGTLLRTTSEGDSLWMYDYAYHDSTVTDCEGTLRDVQATPDGGFVAVGTTYGAISGPNPPGLSQDVWVVKVDSLGCIEPGCNTPMGITTQITNLKDALAVYPNPVSRGASVTVHVNLPEDLRKDPVQITVVNADGRLVEQRNLTPHTEQFTLHTSAYSSGLYHLHLTSGTTWLSGAKLVVE